MNDIRILQNSEVGEALPTDREFEELLAVVTGAVSSGVGGLVLSSGRVMQAVFKKRFFTQLIWEVNEWKKKGRISEEFFDSPQNLNCLAQLLDYFDKDVPNTEVWATLKQIYVVSAMQSDVNRMDLLPYQYIHTVRSLTSTDVLIIFACHKYWNVNKSRVDLSRDNWVANITREANLKHKEIVDGRYEFLVRMGLIAVEEPTLSQGLMLRQTHNFGLTEFGFALCEYASMYESSE